MVVTTASIMHELMTRAIGKDLDPSLGHYVVVIARYHDSSPIALIFGRLQQMLVPFARYLHREGDQYRVLTWDEYSKLGRAVPRRGTVELFAQTADIVYTTTDGHRMRRPHMLLQNQTASSIFGS